MFVICTSIIKELPPPITPGEGEYTLLNYGGGLSSGILSTFTNVINGTVNQVSTKYPWTIDERGINIALVQTPTATARGSITLANISSTAAAAGEAWFTGTNTVCINPKSARFGGASMTEDQWKAAKAAWEKIGIK